MCRRGGGQARQQQGRQGGVNEGYHVCLCRAGNIGSTVEEGVFKQRWRQEDIRALGRSDQEATKQGLLDRT